jgi:Zn-dependent peptidase ImmA (M78 family)
MLKEGFIKQTFFLVLKEGVDSLIPQNDDVSYTETPFVDIETVAKKNGITDVQHVSSQSIFNKHAILVDTVIYVAKEDNQEKQRFAIAHELFHFLTNWPVSDSMQAVAREGEAWKKQNAGSDEVVGEVVSDYFAANLLVPTERFILWEDKTDEEIACAFGVEAKCIKKRREEEIEFELDIMVPKNLSSDTKIEEQTPLSLDELDSILEDHSIHDMGRA